MAFNKNIERIDIYVIINHVIIIHLSDILKVHEAFYRRAVLLASLKNFEMIVRVSEEVEKSKGASAK